MGVSSKGSHLEYQDCMREGVFASARSRDPKARSLRLLRIHICSAASLLWPPANASTPSMPQPLPSSTVTSLCASCNQPHPRLSASHSDILSFNKSLSCPFHPQRPRFMRTDDVSSFPVALLSSGEIMGLVRCLPALQLHFHAQGQSTSTILFTAVFFTDVSQGSC